MPDDLSLEPRVENLEKNLTRLEDVVATLANTVKESGEATQNSINRLYKLQNTNHNELLEAQGQLAVESAKHGAISPSAMLGLISAGIAAAGFILSFCVVVGGLAIHPMKALDARHEDDLQRLEHRTRVEDRMLYILWHDTRGKDGLPNQLEK
jgi:hypothetical protein